MSGNTCDVCGKTAAGVCCSALGAVSFAYCGECAAAGAEPYGILVGTIVALDGIERVSEWTRDVCLPATLARTGKTRADFDAAVQREMAIWNEQGG